MWNLKERHIRKREVENFFSLNIVMWATIFKNNYSYSTVYSKEKANLQNCNYGGKYKGSNKAEVKDTVCTRNTKQEILIFRRGEEFTDGLTLVKKANHQKIKKYWVGFEETRSLP